VNNFTQLINRIGLPRLAAMATVAVLMLGFFAFLIMRAQTPSLAPLYTGLSLEDSSAIVTELQTLNIPFELRGDGETILIPRDEITTVRMNLAGQGLPQRGQVGYEIFDEQSTLGATSFVQNINNVRALEGELARTISSLARIQAARVHLVLPERELFQRERKDPSASIVLTVRGQLSAGEIRAIQHMVSSAIEGLSPARVAIVDSQGNLLASGSGDGVEGALAGETDERTLAFENRLRTRVEDMLANIVGAGRARVEVAAEMDFNRSTTTQETFDPEGQVVRSTQTRESENLANAAAGQVTVANELPGASEQAAAAPTEQGTSTEEVINYEISKTTQTAVTEAGAIKRLSVAVVVDGTYTTGADGVETYAPRSAEEVTQILTLVRSAVGFSETRGDTVEVVNLQFAERPALAPQGTDAGAGLFDFTRDDLMSGAEMAVTLLIGLALVLFVMRPLLKKVLTPEVVNTPLALPPAAEVGHNGVVAANGEIVLASPEMAARDKTPSWVSNAKSMGESQLQTLKQVGGLVEENPKQAALIVRDWLTSAA
jgi:flagellar M-ring protein FliF